ncbi:MAG: FG-GAP repeat domain-containing protein [Candidatus Freyarchaeota archaeon]
MGKEAIVIAEARNETHYYHNLTAIDLGPPPSVKWSVNITPYTTEQPYFQLELANVSDFDLDNRSEIVVAYSDDFSGWLDRLYVFDDNGSLLNNLTSFRQHRGYHSPVVVVDWDGDGVNDILSVHWNSTGRYFNVTYVKNVTSGEFGSSTYSYSDSYYYDVTTLAAGNFNSTSSEPELALLCSNVVFIIDNGTETVKECFSGFSGFSDIYSAEGYLVFATYDSTEDNFTVGCFRDDVWNSLALNISSWLDVDVVDVDLDSKPDIICRYYSETKNQYEYLVIDIESWQETVRNYVPIPLSFGDETKLVVSSSYQGGYTTPTTTERPEWSYSFEIERPCFILPEGQLYVLDGSGRLVSMVSPKFEGESLCMLVFSDYDDDGQLETLGVSGGSILLLELDPVPILTMSTVSLITYGLFTTSQNTDRMYLYVSVILSLAGLSSIATYYIRKRNRALQLDRRFRHVGSAQ